MKTDLLLRGTEVLRTVGTLPDEIDSLCDRSDLTKPGALYFCRKGESSDGKEYLPEAIAKGALAVVVEEEEDCAVPQIVVKDVIAAEAGIAKNFYSDPQRELKIVGVVGTNGKTSVCHVLRAVFEKAGRKTFVVGTIGVYCGEKNRPSELTTPGLLETYSLLAEARSLGAEFFVVEVSAHAIAQRRMEGIYFETLVFTNCTEDHLDYFGDFSRYAAVKKSIFKRENCRRMLVNSDDPVGISLLAENEGFALSYGIENPADAFAIDVSETADGISYVVNLFDAIYDVTCPLVGYFNVYNTLAASACAVLCGVPVHCVAEALAEMSPVPGRGEFVAKYRGGLVFVDYAHTPDGLQRILTSLKKLCGSRLICVFGCGGNREKEKRKSMGRIAGELADFTVITNDNPRFEDPLDVIRSIEEGTRSVTRDFLSVPDREKAIAYALSGMGEGDILLVAGKGAEDYQETMGVRRHFSDREVILSLTGETG